MSDIRKVRVIVKDSQPYNAWLNTDRMLYAEDHGMDWDGDRRCRIALVVLDTGENMRIDAAALSPRRPAHGKRS